MQPIAIAPSDLAARGDELVGAVPANWIRAGRRGPEREVVARWEQSCLDPPPNRPDMGPGFTRKWAPVTRMPITHWRTLAPLAIYLNYLKCIYDVGSETTHYLEFGIAENIFAQNLAHRIDYEYTLW